MEGALLACTALLQLNYALVCVKETLLHVCFVYVQPYNLLVLVDTTTMDLQTITSTFP